MYLLVVLLLQGVLPVASILVEFLFSAGTSLVALVGKWFVFWAVGLRLFTAGLNQVFRPEFTYDHVFKMTDPAAGKLVREIGFGNLAIGGLAILTIFASAWIVPAAIAGAIFYLLAGIQHWLSGSASTKETVALLSDLAVGVILLLFVLFTLFGPSPTISA